MLNDVIASIRRLKKSLYSSSTTEFFLIGKMQFSIHYNVVDDDGLPSIILLYF